MPGLDEPNSAFEQSSSNQSLSGVDPLAVQPLNVARLARDVERITGVLLHAEGQRVQREISGYAQLSQAAMKSTRMIADNVAQWKRAADGLRNS